jgi:CHASE3 domain.
MGGYSITKNQMFLSRYEKVCRQIPIDIEELKTLSSGSPMQTQRVNQIEKIATGGLKELADAMAVMKSPKVDAAQFQARALYKKIRARADDIQSVVKQINIYEGRSSEATEKVKGESKPNSVAVLTMSALTIGLLLLTAIAAYISRSDILSSSSKPRLLTVFLQGAAPVVVPFLVMCSVVYLVTELQVRADEEIRRQMRGNAVIAHANALSKLLYDAGVAMGGYSITKSPLMADRLQKEMKEIPVELEKLRNLVKDNERQSQIIVELEQISEEQINVFDDAKKSIDDSRVDVAQFRSRHVYPQIRSLADRLQDKLRELTAEERKIDGGNPKQKITRRRTYFKFLERILDYGAELSVLDGVIAAVLSACFLSFIFSWKLSKGSKRKTA